MYTHLPVYPVNKAGPLSVLLLSAAVQNAPAGAAASPVTTEAVQLSPFQEDGSQDTGYPAANARSGKRLNARLEHLSASVTMLPHHRSAKR